MLILSPFSPRVHILNKAEVAARKKTLVGEGV